MRIDIVRLVVDVAGSAGSATGSASSNNSVNGRVIAVHIDYTTQPATTDVTLVSTAPSQTILTRTNQNADGWFYPRQLMDATDGADLTGIYESLPVAGTLTASVAQGDPVTGGVVVTVYVERD